jgi:hypothetical protein
VSSGGVNIGGQVALTGGKTSVSTGGTRNVGGGIGTGGKSSTGGTFGTGGKSNTGGKSGGNTGGKGGSSGSTATGGKSSAGGTLGTGGTGGASGGASSSTGGTTFYGGSSSTGGTSSDGGDPLTEFCQGDRSKILYQGTLQIEAPASSYESNIVMDCCTAWGVNLHSKDALGFDLDVETIWSAGGSVSPGVFAVGTSMQPMRALVHRSTDSSSSYGVPADGTAELFNALSFQEPFDLGLCLSLYKTETTLWRTLIYVPKVTIGNYLARARFEIFLLNDSAITPSQASAVGLDSLELAPTPILDLRRIAYVSDSTGEVGFNPGQNIGDIVQSQLDGRGMAVPFIMVADNVRLSLGTFVSNLSSAVYPGPNVTIENIEPDSMVIQFTGTGAEPLKDSRALKVLRETGKLI